MSTFLPATRAEALRRLEEFLPRAGRYGARRNHVEEGHENVSRLSPATSTRLLLETEICRAVRERYAASTVQKLEQEVWWRLYWKGWLEMRPGVWRSYRRDLAGLEWTDRARRVAAGDSGVAIMDSFARELVATGYLHNHARMWWAAFWIHVERLPWPLGADFFLRHLHDGDAASNTLSWRWVAGLHTRGKSYLVRRSNVEKYVDAERLAAAREGIERLDGTATIDLPFAPPPDPEPIPQPAVPVVEGAWGLWVHDEDLLLERSPLASRSPASLAAPPPVGLWREQRYAAAKQEFLRTALADGGARAGEHFGIAPRCREADDLAAEIAGWASGAGLAAVVAMRPFVGPLADRLEAIEGALRAEGIRLLLVRRRQDVAAMNRATAGFFRFWKETASLREGSVQSEGVPSPGPSRR